MYQADVIVCKAFLVALCFAPVKQIFDVLLLAWTSSRKISSGQWFKTPWRSCVVAVIQAVSMDVLLHTLVHPLYNCKCWPNGSVLYRYEKNTDTFT